MPVHFKIASHEANSMERMSNIEDADDLLSSTWGEGVMSNKGGHTELLQSSLPWQEDWSGIYPRRNGFVDTVVCAYNQHYNLVIRPDDVWMAILSQFNIYVNAHAEELRSHFVQHEGQKHLTVFASGTRYTVDFGGLAKQMTALVDENIVDQELKSWIMPNFSTTTPNDTVTCAVYMMSMLKSYFTYEFALRCGIPAVTLEGSKEDWENLLSRIDKMAEFGAEPEAWAQLLRPILKRFVQAFDGNPDVDFWQKICHYKDRGSGSISLCGWVTAFCVWDADGEWQGPSLTAPPPTVNSNDDVTSLIIDGVRYAMIGSRDVPPGFCEVPVKLDDNGVIFDCMMVSGHVAMSVDGQARDTVRPLPAWFMYIK